jgi:hypothetical protein
MASPCQCHFEWVPFLEMLQCETSSSRIILWISATEIHTVVPLSGTPLWTLEVELGNFHFFCLNFIKFFWEYIDHSLFYLLDSSFPLIITLHAMQSCIWKKIFQNSASYTSVNVNFHLIIFAISFQFFRHR